MVSREDVGERCKSQNAMRSMYMHRTRARGKGEVGGSAANDGRSAGGAVWCDRTVRKSDGEWVIVEHMWGR